MLKGCAFACLVLAIKSWMLPNTEQSSRNEIIFPGVVEYGNQSHGSPEEGQRDSLL